MPEYLIVILFGLFFAAAGVGVLLWTIRQKKVCSESTEGTVIGYETRRASKGGRTYCLIFSYTVDGVNYVQTNNSGDAFRKHKEGAKIQVFYNPDNPDQFYIKEIASYLLSFVFILSGVGLMVFSLFIYLGKV